MFVFVVFFFSSRRRHTRWPRDWSSDVCSSDLVDKINFGDGVSRYDLRKEGMDHFHHHLVCMECGSVEEIIEDLLTDIEKKVEDEWKFEVKDHRLTFHGICEKCQKANKKDN